MNASILFMPVGQDRAVAELAAAVLEDGVSASVVAPEGAGKTAVLDRLASELALGQARIVRVACPSLGGLSLPALLSQVVGRAKGGVLSDEDLELASDILTQLDSGCSQIALLVDDAHDLLPPALRYIQLACRSGPLLRVVLAGQPGTLELLRGDEFAYLRQRISRNIQLPVVLATSTELPAQHDTASSAPAQVAVAPAVIAPAVIAPIPVRRRSGSAWALAGLGVAASVAVGLWLNQRDELPAPVAASVAPEGATALARLADPIDVPPSAAPAEVPPTTPEPAMAGVAVPAAPAEASPPVLAEVEPIPADEPATLREVAAVLPGPALEVPSLLTEAAQPASEAAAVDASPAPEQLTAAAEPDLLAELVTPREAAALHPSSRPPATVVDLSVAPGLSEPAAMDALTSPEPLTADVAAKATRPDTGPTMADAAPVAEPSATAPSQDVVAAEAAPPGAEPVVADVTPAAEPPAAVAESLAAPPAPEPSAVAAGPEAPAAPEPTVADAAPAPPEASAPVVASLPEPGAPAGAPPGAADAESAMTSLPVAPIPAPVPAMAVVAMPEAPRRVLRPARMGPERVVAYDARTDERRCRDIVLRAQLGEDITNADRQFLRAGCRAGR